MGEYTHNLYNVHVCFSVPSIFVRYFIKDAHLDIWNQQTYKQRPYPYPYTGEDLTQRSTLTDLRFDSSTSKLSLSIPIWTTEHHFLVVSLLYDFVRCFVWNENVELANSVSFQIVEFRGKRDWIHLSLVSPGCSCYKLFSRDFYSVDKIA